VSSTLQPLCSRERGWVDSFLRVGSGAEMDAVAKRTIRAPASSETLFVQLITSPFTVSYGDMHCQYIILCL